MQENGMYDVRAGAWYSDPVSKPGKKKKKWISAKYPVWKKKKKSKIRILTSGILRFFGRISVVGLSPYSGSSPPKGRCSHFLGQSRPVVGSMCKNGQILHSEQYSNPVVTHHVSTHIAQE